jgi:hypothetical protein
MNKFVKNGLHITLLNVLFILLFNFHPFLCTTICLKLYTTNYFYWFGTEYNYFKNKRLNFIKQFVKFTDFGHLASLLYYFYPPFLPVAHNIHFVITFVYWLARFVWGVEDTSDIIHPELSQDCVNFWSIQSHFIPYLLILNEVRNKEIVVFNNYTLTLTFCWMYFWIFFIYYPWRMLTNDCIYSNLKNKFPYFGFFCIHLIHILANYSGSVFVNYNQINYI